MSHNQGRPTNQCRQCGARYLPDAPRCPYHRDVEVWVRGALVRFAVIWWPSQGDRPPDAEIAHHELVGRTHFRSYWHLVRDGMPRDVVDLVIREFWDAEDYEATWTVEGDWIAQPSQQHNEEAA